MNYILRLYLLTFFTPILEPRSGLLALTVSFALCTDIVAEHGTKNEVLLGRQLVERTGDKQTYGIETLPATEIDIYVLLASRLNHVVYRLAGESLAGLLFETTVAGEEYHPAHTFLIFIDMVHQNFHF